MRRESEQGHSGPAFFAGAEIMWTASSGRDSRHSWGWRPMLAGLTSYFQRSTQVHQRYLLEK
jgi:hypothetical protein